VESRKRGYLQCVTVTKIEVLDDDREVFHTIE
jgi:hypothetical protein